MQVLRKTLEKNKKYYIEKLTDFVKIDTHTIGHGIDGGLEHYGQEYLIKLFNEIGAEKITKDPLKESIIEKSIEKFQEGNRNHNYDKRYNVYAKFKGENSKSIMFNGHVDTMPAGNKKLWTSDPYKAEIRDGKIYGLGVCDMKGGLMAAIMAVKLIKDSNIQLPIDVLVTAVADEEGGGNGSIVAAMNGQKADAVVVCEPSDREIIAAHMGFVFFNIEVKGLAVHSGSKWTGVNAIEKAVKIMNAINELEHKWLMKYKHSLLPVPTSNFGVIEGGTAGSTVADKCTIKTCVHYIPRQMNYKQVVKEYTEAIKRCSLGDEWLKNHIPEISVYQAGGGFEMDLEHDFLKTLISSHKAVYNKNPKIVGSPAGCDSRIWKNIANCPTLQYGPGSIKECHTIDEYLEVSEYTNAILVYSELILSFLK